MERERRAELARTKTEFTPHAFFNTARPILFKRLLRMAVETLQSTPQASDCIVREKIMHYIFTVTTTMDNNNLFYRDIISVVKY